VLITNASQVEMGAFLCQLREDFLRPLRCISKTFNMSQKNCTTAERECLAIVESIKFMKPVLFGIKFIVIMDHATLNHLREFRDLSSRVMRWATYLGPLTFRIHFGPVTEHVSDFLSRIDFEDIDYHSAKKFELQTVLSYVSVSMDDHEDREHKDVNEHQEVSEDKNVEWSSRS